MQRSAKGKMPTMPLALSRPVAAPVGRVGDRVVWECPRCHHQFCSDASPPAPSSPLVHWLRLHVACAHPALPKGSSVAIEHAAIQALAELEGEGH